jgi:hypothetical protein
LGGRRFRFAEDSAIPWREKALEHGSGESTENTMGRFDRRNSMKMKRRRAQNKKLAREKKARAAAKTPAAAPAKKSRSKAQASA